MVARGPRPQHRRGTTGARWVKYRNKHVNQATNCCYCGTPFNRTAPCNHPTHARMPGCPTHPHYPTLEHPTPLARGGHPLDPGALVACYSCNASRGAALRRKQPTPSRTW